MRSNGPVVKPYLASHLGLGLRERPFYNGEENNGYHVYAIEGCKRAAAPWEYICILVVGYLVFIKEDKI